MLGTLLLAWFALVWFVDRPSPRRTVAAGILLGLAAITRPYTLLLPLAFAAAGLRLRLPAFAPRRVALLALLSWALFGTWIARNYYCFHRPLVTSYNLAFDLWLATYPETDWMDGGSHAAQARIEQRLLALRIEAGDHRLGWSAHLQRAAVGRVRERPLRYLTSCLLRLPRLWIPTNAARFPLWTLLVIGVYHTLIFAAMLVGLVRLRSTRNTVLAGSGVIVLYFSLCLLPIAAEARRTLPARPFQLFLSASGITALRRRSRKAGRPRLPGQAETKRGGDALSLVGVTGARKESEPWEDERVLR